MWLSVRVWFIVNTLALILLLAAQFGFGSNFKDWNWWPDLFNVLTSILTGGLISFLFYFLVVLIPERRKKSVIKNNLTKVYKDIKHDILWQIVFASIQGGRTDLTTDTNEVENLLRIDAFKATFEHGTEANEGFYAFENQMSGNTHEFREIILSLRVLSKQIDYILHNYAIEDPKAFDFFKRLEIFLMRMERLEPGYDESKSLCRFIWEIFAGFNFIDGYRGYDPIEKMIKEI